jgi:alpha-pyrone synthase
MTTAYLNRIATAVPPHDMHGAFVPFAESLLSEGTPRNLYRRMVRLSAIDHRYSFLKPIVTDKGVMQDEGALFVRGHFPSTARRMEAFRQFAPQLARCALLKLALTDSERQGITHVIVTCCTGLYAPGIDYEVIELSGLVLPSSALSSVSWAAMQPSTRSKPHATSCAPNPRPKSCSSRSSYAPCICRRPRISSNC